MGKYDKLKKNHQENISKIKMELNNYQVIANEYSRVSTVYSKANIIINDIEHDFSTATGLGNIDIIFLFFATALQCVRQYLLPDLSDFKIKSERPNDKEAAIKAGKNNYEYTPRIHGWYNPTLSEIITHPVPFDAICQTKNVKGALKGAGRMGHRLTPGHDPILGWIFGTANIATSTLTKWNMDSYHVKTGFKQGNGESSQVDFISNHADTVKVFHYTVDKAFHQEMEGKRIIVTSLLKEAHHLQSDVTSKNSLPFPIVAMIDPKYANDFAEYGIDTCNMLRIGEQEAYAKLINFLIAILHRLTYDVSSADSLISQQVKTKKILLYSNIIASLSNFIKFAMAETIAAVSNNSQLAKDGVKYFDIGGLMTTIKRLISDGSFIRNIKQEFIEKQWYDIVIGKDYEF